MKRPVKDRSIEDSKKSITSSYRASIARYLADLHKEISSLDLQDEKVLPIAICSLTRIEEVDQSDVASCLGQSRLQIGRWSREEHIPRNAAYRAFLCGKLLEFIQAKAEEFTSNRAPKKSDEPSRAPARSTAKLHEPVI